MTDESSAVPPSSDDPGLELGSCPEDELDSLLEQAVTLANAVTEEIGTTDGPSFSPYEALDSDLSDSADAAVDERLGELDGLLGRTREELGTATASDHEVPAEPPPKEATASASPEDDMPDFMAELTRPEVRPEADVPPHTPSPANAASGASRRGATSTKCDPATTFAAAPHNSDERAGAEAEAVILEDLSLSPVAPPSAAPHAAAGEENLAAELDKPVPARKVSRRLAAGAAFLRKRIIDKAASSAIFVCDSVVHVLELLDRPIARLGYVGRRMIGWLAIATMGTSIVVYVISMF